MNQKVKLQVSCDLLDVPSFSGTMLTEVISDVKKLDSLLGKIVNQLQNIPITKQEDSQKLLEPLADMEVVRMFLLKIDSRVSDTVSIVGGLYDALNKSPEDLEKQNKQQQEDDNVTTG